MAEQPPEDAAAGAGGVALTVRVAPHPVAAPFHRLLTRPALSVDGEERIGPWGRFELRVSPGAHEVGVAFRYRGRSRARLGGARTRLTVPESASHVELHARLGPLNSDPFRFRPPVVR
ncbi:hypothetical protein [Streptomyces tremellae]|uniref:hypothetical protein n=1 Tax=Streptomyces tremellae TaxID=1124239 RepID=UPI0031EEF02B